MAIDDLNPGLPEKFKTFFQTQFDAFKKRPTQTFKEALPRTLAPVGFASGFWLGSAGMFMMSGIATIVSSGTSMETMDAIKFMGLSTLYGGMFLGCTNYCVTYVGTTLAMAGLPFLKDIKSRNLVPPGVEYQVMTCGLAVVPVVTLGLVFSGMALREDSSTEQSSARLRI